METYSHYVWIRELGKKGINPHIHAIISGYPEKLRTDNITSKFKRICYEGQKIPENTRRLIRTKYVTDFGTLYNEYFKKEKVKLHIKGYVKEDLDKLSVRKTICSSKLMTDKIFVSKQTAPYMMREYALQKKLYSDDGKILLDKVITYMIKDGYIVHHLFGKSMRNIVACIQVLDNDAVSHISDSILFDIKD